jgi:Rps23 Pro-64 3,4-dihydroxylase Tpa1-like proline 4-hydroxylase
VRGVRSSPFNSIRLTRDFGDPASVAYSIFVDALQRVLGDVEYLTGKQDEDWQHFNGSAVVYPPHGALNWHSDRKYAASYSFYCQREWQRRWGGELLVLEEEPPRWSVPHDGKSADGQEPEVVDDVGYFVTPIANRLVVMRGATPHRIAAVSAAAGEHHRMSITGFFVPHDPGERNEA